MTRSLTRLQPMVVKWIAAAALAVLLLSGLFLYQRGAFKLAASSRLLVTSANQTMPVSSEIEAKWGIRPTMVALTVDNGMLDLRYQVLDPEKAAQMMDQLDTMPRIITQTGQEISLAELMAHSHNLEAGRTYYVLYPNVKNAVKPGTEVTLVIGGLKLLHVPVRN